MESIVIKMTESQKEKLLPLIDEVYKGSNEDKPILFLAHLLIADGELVGICNVVDNEKSKQIQQVIGKHSVGEVATKEYLQTALMNASAT